MRISDWSSDVCSSDLGPLRRVKSVIAIRSLAMRKGMALLMVALLGGCNLAPPHVRPDLPTAADYPPSYAGDATLGQRAVEIGWRDFFSDPRLEQLVATALVSNSDLAIAIRSEADRVGKDGVSTF